jgi:hypothetical protein
MEYLNIKYFNSVLRPKNGLLHCVPKFVTSYSNVSKSLNRKMEMSVVEHLMEDTKRKL